MHTDRSHLLKASKTELPIATEICATPQEYGSKASVLPLGPSVGCLAFFHDPVADLSYHIVRRTPVANAIAGELWVHPPCSVGAFEAENSGDWFDVLLEQAFPSFVHGEGPDVVGKAARAKESTSQEVDPRGQEFDIWRAHLCGARVWWNERHQRFHLIADVDLLELLGSPRWLAQTFGLVEGTYRDFVDPDSVPRSLREAGLVEEGPDIAYVLDRGELVSYRYEGPL
jgi:hypothetical protein